MAAAAAAAMAAVVAVAAAEVAAAATTAAAAAADLSPHVRRTDRPSINSVHGFRAGPFALTL